MAVVRRNVLTSPHTPTYAAGVLHLATRSASVTAAQLNGSSIVRQAPGGRIFGTATELNPAAELVGSVCLVARRRDQLADARWRQPRPPRARLRALASALSAPSRAGGPDGHGRRRLRLALPGLGRGRPAASGRPTQRGDLDAYRAAPGSGHNGAFGELRVRLVTNPLDNRVYVVPAQPIRRNAGQDAVAPALPNRSDQAHTFADATFDRPNWNAAANSFRNKLEGWRDAQTPPRQPPRMHNRIHVFVGGSMAPASSPNDPIFFLNHCNVDRQWEAWLTQHGRTYVPGSWARPPPGHRTNDPMLSIVWAAMRPSDLLNPGSAGLDWYRYDALPA